MSSLMVLLILPLIIGMLGEVFKKLILVGKMPKTGWPSWRGVYFITYKFHSLLVGSLFGIFMFKNQIPWPVDVFGSSLGSAILAGIFAGGVAMVAYSVVIGTIKNLICQLSLKKTANTTESDDDA